MVAVAIHWPYHVEGTVAEREYKYFVRLHISSALHVHYIQHLQAPVTDMVSHIVAFPHDKAFADRKKWYPSLLSYHIQHDSYINRLEGQTQEARNNVLDFYEALKHHVHTAYSYASLHKSSIFKVYCLFMTYISPSYLKVTRNNHIVQLSSKV